MPELQAQVAGHLGVAQSVVRWPRSGQVHNTMHMQTLALRLCFRVGSLVGAGCLGARQTGKLLRLQALVLHEHHMMQSFAWQQHHTAPFSLGPFCFASAPVPPHLAGRILLVPCCRGPGQVGSSSVLKHTKDVRGVGCAVEALRAICNASQPAAMHTNR